MKFSIKDFISKYVVFEFGNIYWVLHETLYYIFHSVWKNYYPSDTKNFVIYPFMRKQDHLNIHVKSRRPNTFWANW